MTRQKHTPSDGAEALTGAYEDLSRANDEIESLRKRLADLTISHDLHAENSERLEARLTEAEALLPIGGGT